jgi:hypothetical protein
LERSACILGLIIVGGSPARSVAPHVAHVNYRKCPDRGRGPMGGGGTPDFTSRSPSVRAGGRDQLPARGTRDEDGMDDEPLAPVRGGADVWVAGSVEAEPLGVRGRKVHAYRRTGGRAQRPPAEAGGPRRKSRLGPP